MKKFLTATSIALFALAPAASFAQSDSGQSSNPKKAAAVYPASGGAEGAASAHQVALYSALAGVGAAAVIGGAFAAANSGSDNKNVNIGSTGTTGTTGTN